MLTDRIEGKWIDVFAEVFALCKVGPGDLCAVLSESQSRPLNVQLAELALHRLGARPFHVVVPTARQSAPVPIRSTGASSALQNLGPAIDALAASAFVADCTLEGLMHAAELPRILKGGARVRHISNEHPDVLDRLVPSPPDEQHVRAGMRALRVGKRVKVTSPADAELMREYMAAWGDREAYAVSHVGWGTNRRARWDALALYDRRDLNGTEQRAFAGNFLYSTGANEVAGRHTLGHFDLPLRHCTVALDGSVVVDAGRVLP